MTNIDKAKYWILNCVVDVGYPLTSLRREVVGYHSGNYHGLDDMKLIQTLAEMFADGLIVAEAEYRGQEIEEFVPDLNYLKQIFSIPETAVCYYLTTRGGQLWEDLSKPNWLRYVTTEHHENPFDLYGGSIDTIDEYVSFCYNTWIAHPSRIWPDSDPPEALEAAIITIATETVEPWRTTYWKTLETGIKQRIKVSGDLFENPPWYSAQESIGWYTIPEDLLPFPQSPKVTWDFS